MILQREKLVDSRLEDIESSYCTMYQLFKDNKLLVRNKQ